MHESVLAEGRGVADHNPALGRLHHPRHRPERRLHLLVRRRLLQDRRRTLLNAHRRLSPARLLLPTQGARAVLRISPANHRRPLHPLRPVSPQARRMTQLQGAMNQYHAYSRPFYTKCSRVPWLFQERKYELSQMQLRFSCHSGAMPGDGTPIVDPSLSNPVRAFDQFRAWGPAMFDNNDHPRIKVLL